MAHDTGMREKHVVVAFWLYGMFTRSFSQRSYELQPSHVSQAGLATDCKFVWEHALIKYNITWQYKDLQAAPVYLSTLTLFHLSALFAFSEILESVVRSGDWKASSFIQYNLHDEGNGLSVGLLPSLNIIIKVRKDNRSYSGLMSSGTPPMNRSVSRFSPSVPRGLSPSMCGSLSTLSMALRRLRVTTSWCQRPWLICTLLTTVPVPEPVLNLRMWVARSVSFSRQHQMLFFTQYTGNPF